MSKTQDTYAQVERYYAETLTGSDDLRTNACCDGSAIPDVLKPLLAAIHPEVASRYYGCGLVAPDALEGLRVLDLGCGAGRDCFLLSRLVGEHGRVVGVDMTDAQLAVAERHRDYHAERWGYSGSNVQFVKGHIERLGELGLPAGGFNLIVSNCVINLSPDKPAVLAGAFDLLAPGGELYFSDVYADRRLPADWSQDPVLYGECLAGALYWRDFLSLARAAGFADPRLVEARPLSIEDPRISRRVAPTRFCSATYRLFRIDGLEAAPEDYGQRASYRGSLPEAPSAWALDREHRFPTGKAVAISGNSFQTLRASRFATHFDLDAGDGRHRGGQRETVDPDPFAVQIACMPGVCC